MKTFLFATLVLVHSTVLAQNVYKTALSNTPETRVEIMQGSATMYIVGHTAGEVVIETDYVAESSTDATGMKHTGRKPGTGNDERAKGLKPLSSTGPINTDVGLNVEKGPGAFRIIGMIGDAMDKTYTIAVPDQASLMITDINPGGRSKVEIKNIKGEISLTLLNRNVKMEAIDGPVVLQSTNGNVEIVYDRLDPDKPNSIASVNGFVDITLPKNTGARIALNSINGKAFTDFDINTDKSHSPSLIPSLQMTTIQGTINGGGVPFDISTVNGDIYLRKGQ